MHGDYTDNMEDDHNDKKDDHIDNVEDDQYVLTVIINDDN